MDRIYAQPLVKGSDVQSLLDRVRSDAKRLLRHGRLTWHLPGANPQPASTQQKERQSRDQRESRRLELNPDLEVDQRALELGTPVPIVFGYGVWLSPPSVYSSFDNRAGSTIRSVTLVPLSEGLIGNVLDVWWGGKRGQAAWRWQYGGTPTGIDYTHSYGLRHYAQTTTKEQQIVGFGGKPYRLHGERGNREKGTYLNVFESDENCVRLWATVKKQRHQVYFEKPRSVNTSTGKPSDQRIEVGPFDVTGQTWSLPESSGAGLPRVRSITVRSSECRAVFASGTYTQYDTFSRLVDEWELKVKQTLQLEHPLPEIPATRGGGNRTAANLTMMAVQSVTAAGNDRHRKQVHCRIDGIKVNRLRDGATATSNHFPDLVNYLARTIVPSDLIDVEALRTAAQFCNAQGLHYSGVLDSPFNFFSWLGEIAPYFLCIRTNRKGKIGLRPIFNYDGSYRISTVITPRYTLTNDDIIDGSYSRDWVPRAERQPVIMQMVWRRSDADINTAGTQSITVRYADTQPSTTVTETHDLSGFCTTVAHAMTVARYLLSRRRRTTHGVRINVPLTSVAQGIGVGDTVRVRVRRDGALSDDYYWVNSANRLTSGAVTLELTEIPRYGFANWIAQETISGNFVVES